VELLVIGLSHRNSPVEVRERLAVAPADIEARLQQIVEVPGIAEAALLSTCNRVEVYAAAQDGRAALAALREHLLAVPGGGPELDRHLYQHAGREAALHLFRVAASLDSLVVGEPQILGQIKEAFETAMRVRSAGPVLGFTFQRAFRVARKARRETGIARDPVSVSSVAVDLARTVWSGFEGRRVLLVGAGKMADLAARALRLQGATVAVTNRTAARAAELAARLGCQTEPWDDLAGALTRADIVISSTGAREPIIGRPLLERVQRARRWSYLVLIDIAVPRDVDPGVETLDNVFRWDIDHLQREAARNLESRRQEADRAEALVEAELHKFLGAVRGRGVGPTINALRSRFLGVARAEADKTVAGLSGLDERQRRAVQAMAEAIAAKLLHAPQVAIKRGAAGEDGDALIEAVSKLFDLPAVEALDPASEADADDEDDDAAAKKVSGS
jgi:glutamyl-tRNA reductase